MAFYFWIGIGVLDLLIVTLFVLLCLISLRRKPADIADRQFPPDSHKAKLQAAVMEGRRFFRTHPGELLVIEANGEELCARRFAQENPRGRIVLFHGYRSMGETDFAPVMDFYYNQGYELVLIDQRAHGKSSGLWIGFGVPERYDCLSWLRYLNATYGALPTFLSGVSMGCTTVLMSLGLELPANVRGVIADCGFTSPKEIISIVLRRRHLPPLLLTPPLSLFSRLFAGYFFGEYSTLQALAENTRIPVLFLHGTDDRLVPPEMTRRNFEACRSEKELLMVEGAGHGTAYLQDRPQVEQAVKAFFTRYN